MLVEIELINGKSEVYRRHDLWGNGDVSIDYAKNIMTIKNAFEVVTNDVVMTLVRTSQEVYHIFNTDMKRMCVKDLNYDL